MAAETNVIKSSDLSRVREVELTQIFVYSLQKLIDALGITRKIPKQSGSVLKVYKVTGQLQDGNVAEGEIIPLSNYRTVQTPVGEITLKKWRKSTTVEAISDKGFDQAADDTDNEMVLDIQKGIRKDFFEFLATGTGKAEGTNLQKTLAKTWGQLAVLFDDETVDAAYFLNPLDVADYLGSANITTQTAFGMTYIENFLGLGTVFLNGTVPQGTVYGTAKNNIIFYYVQTSDSDITKAFNMTSDELGLIAIHSEADYTRLTYDTTAMSGIELLVEKIDGVVVGKIAATTSDTVSGTETQGDAETQDDTGK